jgi:uncharacterized membrane protein YphA (DoxX/SURF4 family)
MASNAATQVQLVLRLALGLIFFVSAVAKLRDPAAFVQGVLEYRVLPRRLAQLYGRLLPFAEIGTALLLLSGFFLAVAAALAVLMLASFATAVAVVTLQGREIGCHCFGQSASDRVGWHTLVRDLLLLLPAAWLLWGAAPRGMAPADWPNNGLDAATVVLAVLLALGYWLVAEALDLLADLTHPHREMV